MFMSTSLRVKTGSARLTERVHALNGMDLQIRQWGNTWGSLASPVVAKSTLAQLLMGMLKPSHGQLCASVADKQHTGMQMVFQDPAFIAGSALTGMADYHRTGVDRKNVLAERERRMRWLKIWLRQVGIRPEYLDRLPHAFSGGQRQRIAIARALSSAAGRDCAR